MAEKTEHVVYEIDGLFVPATVAGDDGAGQGFESGTVTFWGTGYPTRERALDCIEIAEGGGVNPPGTPVSQETGKRV